MSIAARTSHTDGAENPDNACAMVSPPAAAMTVRPTMTMAAPGSGCAISPTMVATKTAVIRQPSGDTASGAGIR